MKHYKPLQKWRLQELVHISHARELKKSLSALATRFDSWKLGEIASLQMEEILHQHDCNESQQLWSLYNTPRLEYLLARAIVKGLLSEQEVGTKIMKLLADEIAFYKNGDVK